MRSSRTRRPSSKANRAASYASAAPGSAIRRLRNSCQSDLCDIAITPRRHSHASAGAEGPGRLPASRLINCLGLSVARRWRYHRARSNVVREVPSTTAMEVTQVVDDDLRSRTWPTHLRWSGVEPPRGIEPRTCSLRGGRTTPTTASTRDNSCSSHTFGCTSGTVRPDFAPRLIPRQSDGGFSEVAVCA